MSKLYSINVIDINGEVRENLATRTIELEFICKGGFRFLAEETLDIDDRLRVKLKFPDNSMAESVTAMLSMINVMHTGSVS